MSHHFYFCMQHSRAFCMHAARNMSHVARMLHAKIEMAFFGIFRYFLAFLWGSELFLEKCLVNATSHCLYKARNFCLSMYVPAYFGTRPQRPELNRSHHVNLLLLSQGNRKHYVCIKDMSRLVFGRTNYRNQTFVCNGCLHPFSSKAVLDRHTPECMRNPPQAVKYPDPDNCTVKFQAHKKTISSSLLSRLRFWIFSVPRRRRWRWAL